MKTMPGAQEDAIRDNPPVRSKFDKSHGRGLPAPHMSSPGPVMPTTNPAPRVYSEPKSVGSSGSIKSQHIPPSQLGCGMAEGRHYAQSPNMAQTQMQGKSSGVAGFGFAPGTAETAYGRDPIKSAKQHDTVAANPRFGTEVKSRSTQVKSDNRVTSSPKRAGPGVLAGSKRT